MQSVAMTTSDAPAADAVAAGDGAQGNLPAAYAPPTCSVAVIARGSNSGDRGAGSAGSGDRSMGGGGGRRDAGSSGGGDVAMDGGGGEGEEVFSCSANDQMKLRSVQQLGRGSFRHYLSSSVHASFGGLTDGLEAFPRGMPIEALDETLRSDFCWRSACAISTR